MRHVPPKRQLTFNRLHGVISQKAELFITIAVRTSNPTKVYVPSNMHIQLVKGKFKEVEKAAKSLVIKDCNIHIDFVYLIDRMANGYSISKRTWKLTKDSSSTC
jgi:hypothetical protein